MKTHEKKPYSIEEAETHRGVTCREMKNVDQAAGSATSSVKCTNIYFEKLENNIITDMNEFNRKIELGRNVKIIINKHGFNSNSLQENMKEALKTYELYGKDMDIKEINWRGWQNDLREYLDNPCDRKIIWVVGVEGTEGKSFFQRNVCEEFGYSRV